MQKKWRFVLLALIGLGGVAIAWAIFHATDHPELLTYTGHTEDVWSVAFSPDGKRLASGDRLGSVKVIDTLTGKEQATLHLDEGGGSVVTVAFSPDGKVLAALNPVQLKRWQVDGWKELPALEASSGGLAGAFSPDNVWFAVAGGDKAVMVWELATGRSRHVHSPPTEEVRTLAFRPDSKVLAFAGTREKESQHIPFIATLDLSSGQRENIYEGDMQRVYVGGLSYVSPQLLAFTEGNLVRLLDLKKGEAREVCAAVYPCIATRPDGQMFAVGDSEIPSLSVTLYEAPAWKKAQTLRGPTEEIKALAFSNDNRLLAAAGFDKTVRIWNLAKLRRTP